MSTDPKAAAVAQVDALITRWRSFDIDARVVDIANRFLSPVQANEFIAAVRGNVAELDLENQLSAVVASIDAVAPPAVATASLD
jgi:hypothetical protein